MLANTSVYLDTALAAPRPVEDIIRSRRLSAMAPAVTKELRQYASFLRSSGRLGTAHGVDFLIAQLEGQV